MNRSLEGIKICIDAGHYGKMNRCPVIPEYYESDMVWKLHLLQKRYFEMLGATVITTRTNQNVDKELTARGACAKGCHLFISNHSNAIGSGMNDSIDYVAVYHLVEDKNTYCDDISKAIAQKIAPAIDDVMKPAQGYKILVRKSSNDRNKDGVMNDNYYGVLHGARSVNVPGLILEHSFHTCSKAVHWLLKESNLDLLARSEAEAIATYFAGKPVRIESENVAFQPYTVKVANVNQGDVLNIRKEPNASSKITGRLRANDPNIYTIVAEENNWGMLKSGIGWVNLKYTKRV